MPAPSTTEAPISQIPALQLLQKLGYQYLQPEEIAVERHGKKRFVLLEGILRKQLKRLNHFTVKGRDYDFTDENISRAIQMLREPAYDGLVRTSEKIYDLLTLGESFEQEIEGEKRSPQLRYIDWEHPQNNTFHVTAEFDVERAASHKTRRPDIVCFINGIPLVVIECKRPDEKDSLDAAIKQHLRNQENDQIPQLFLYSQLLLSLNKNQASYGTTGTAMKFWSQWREMNDLSQQVSVLVNTPPQKLDHADLFSGMFRFAKEEFETLAMMPREVTEQDAFLYAMCRPERLIELIGQFILYDEGGAVKKIARYQQYFAVKKTLERVSQFQPDGRRKGGVIWHTQGSGKSLTMVLLAKALATESGIENPRIILVTDRISLDEQIWKTFQLCGKEPKQAKTGKHLIELLADSRVPIITTVIDKFSAASKAATDFVIEDNSLFVLVDESHRGHYGEANTRMLKVLPKASFIGFTGTPLMKKEKNTAKKFGGFIDPAYTIKDAVADAAVVPLYYEGRHIMQDVNEKGVDTMFEALSEGLNKEQQADLKRKFASRDEVNRLESRLYLIAWDISKHYAENWQGTGFKAQLTAPGKKEAIALKRLLDEFGKVSSEVVISAPDDREGDDPTEAEESVLRFWRGMMEKYGNEKEYNRALISSFKKSDEPEILIVVDKLLTGFDAPRNRILYITRSLKEHTLLQAIARVNRLYPGKDEGLIVDYYGVVSELNDALELYGSLEEKFDQVDLEGTLLDITDELKTLPDRRAAVWRHFSEIENQGDEESYELALEDTQKREMFYTDLSKFNRTLKLALANLEWMRANSEEQISEYKRDALFFQRLRSSIKIRYAEEIDYRDYETQISKMLNRFVQADEVIQVVDPVNIFETEKFEAEVEKIKTPRGQAETIANRLKKTITERMDEDPFFYRKLSRLIQQTIADYKEARFSEVSFLKKMREHMESLKRGREEEIPTNLLGKDLAQALYGSMKEQLTATEETRVREDTAGYGSNSSSDESGTTSSFTEVYAVAALQVEDLIRKHSIVGWRENEEAQNRMRNDIDDYLFRLQQENGIKLSMAQMDDFIETAINIAKKRPQDV